MQKKRVLVIEDNSDIRESTAEILELTGEYTVMVAEEGKTGAELAFKHQSDIILCDIMMPDLDGFGILYMLSKNKKNRRIPFIFLTAKTEKSDLRKAMEMSANDYLTRPFDDLELLHAIQSRFKKRAQIQSNVAGSAIDSTHLGDKEQMALLNELAGSGKTKLVNKKQSIYDAGDTPRYVYYVQKGRVRSYLNYQDGRELSIRTFIENEFFGLESVLLNDQYGDSAATLEDSEIALIHKDKFYELLLKKRQLYRVLSKCCRLISGKKKNRCWDSHMIPFVHG